MFFETAERVAGRSRRRRSHPPVGVETRSRAARNSGIHSRKRVSVLNRGSRFRMRTSQRNFRQKLSPRPCLSSEPKPRPGQIASLFREARMLRWQILCFRIKPWSLFFAPANPKCRTRAGPGIPARTRAHPHSTPRKMAAVVTSSMAARVVAGSAASGSRARGAANLKAVKMGKTTKRGALVVSAVRFPSLDLSTRGRTRTTRPTRAVSVHGDPHACDSAHPGARAWRASRASRDRRPPDRAIRSAQPHPSLYGVGSGTPYFLSASARLRAPASARSAADDLPPSPISRRRPMPLPAATRPRSSRLAPTRRRSSPSTATWRPSPPT